MGVEFESGYTLPGGDEPLTHARILHKGNRIDMKSVVADQTASSSVSADVLDNALTYERWKPFDNVLVDPSDFSTSEWFKTGVTVASDGMTIAETAGISFHSVKDFLVAVFTATEWVFSARVKRQTVPEIQLLVENDGTKSVYFDLRTGTIGTQVGATGDIVDLGDGEYLCRIYWAGAVDDGTVNIILSNGSETRNYDGDPNNTIKVLEAIAHPSVATVDFTPFTAGEADSFCLAAHNLGTSGGRITIEHGAGHADIMGASITPTDNAPIMAIFEPLTPTEWRMTVDRAVLPEIGIVRWGKALQMTRPIFGGVVPLDLARKTTMRSNKSSTGEWLGRTKLRTMLATTFDWTNIDDSWVYSNWPEFQQASEDEPFFLAWRPITYSSVGYCSTQAHAEPANTGTRGLMSVSLNVTGFLNV